MCVTLLIVPKILIKQQNSEEQYVRWKLFSTLLCTEIFLFRFDQNILACRNDQAPEGKCSNSLIIIDPRPLTNNRPETSLIINYKVKANISTAVTPLS